MLQKKNNKYIIFSAIASIIVLWKLLLPGYILTLDFSFGPIIRMPVFGTTPLSNFIIYFAQYLLGLVFRGWIVQKIVLFSLFFLMFYLPLRFYLFSESKYGSEYFVSIFYVVNPFVYQRFLAGQYLVLFGYALIPVFFYFLSAFFHSSSWRNLFYLFLSLFLIGAVSVHFLVISSIVFFIYFLSVFVLLCYLKDFSRLLDFTKKIFLGGVIFLVLSSYWIFPYLNRNVDNVSAELFTEEHLEIFKTSKDARLGLTGNVLALYGFWGEGQNWVNLFVDPGVFGKRFILCLSFLLILVISGIFLAIRDKNNRPTALFVLLVCFLAIIFSSGLGEGIFKNINLWLFENIGFWKGFRDTQKWSGLIVFSYAMFGGFGVEYLLGKIKDVEIRRNSLIFLCLVVLYYTYPVLFGFYGQLKPVWYPKEWDSVNQILKKDNNCKALFLPWYLYYSTKFNNNLIVANTAPNFFNCEIVSSKNMGEGVTEGNERLGKSYGDIEQAVTSNDAEPELTIETLRENNIKYIIYTKDLERGDKYKYPFLKSKYISEVTSFSDISLYGIESME